MVKIYEICKNNVEILQIMLKYVLFYYKSGEMNCNT